MIHYLYELEDEVLKIAKSPNINSISNNVEKNLSVLRKIRKVLESNL